MEFFATKSGSIILNDGCPEELRECAIQALNKPSRIDFRALVRCATYDDEVWHYAMQALLGSISSRDEDKEIIQMILDNYLSCEEAQALIA